MLGTELRLLIKLERAVFFTLHSEVEAVVCQNPAP